MKDRKRSSLSVKKQTEIHYALLISILLIVGTVGAFWGVKDAAFVNYDDPVYVTKNPVVQRGLTMDNIKWAFTEFHYNNWHPLTTLSYMADCELFGLNPRAFHLVNLGLHVANTLLLFLVLRRITGAIWASAIVAAFFGWHPLHVESVAWVSERKDVLSTLFWLLTMWAYSKYVNRRTVIWYTAMLALFALGLMAKAMLVTLPFILVLLDVWPLRRVDPGIPGWLSRMKPLILEKLLLFLVAGAAGYVTYLAQGEAVSSTENLMIGYRIENAFVAYIRYLGKTFWPIDLAVFYPHPVRWRGWQVAGAAALILLVSMFAIWTARKRPYLLAGWFWFLGTLAPVIGIVQIGSQSIADRYMYVPSIGLYIAIVWGLRELLALRHWPGTVTALATAAALIACGWLTAWQVGRWKSSVDLFMHAERVAPANIVTLTCLTAALLDEGRTNEAKVRVTKALQIAPQEHLGWWNAANISAGEGKLDEAVLHYRRALQAKSTEAGLHYALGEALRRQGKTREAIESYRQAITLRTDYQAARMNLAGACMGLGDFNAAATNYLAIIQAQPTFAPARYGLGVVYLETGRIDDALAQLSKAVQLKPNFAEAHRELGSAFAKKGKRPEARQHLDRALTLNPGDSLAHACLAGVLLEMLDTAQAVTAYRQAIRLNPKLAPALNNLAWLLSTHDEARFRDGEEAVRLALQACELSGWQYPTFLGTLAAAYAEAGQFVDAVETAKKAIELAESEGQSDLAKKNRDLLNVYRDGQPWRQLAR